LADYTNQLTLFQALFIKFLRAGPIRHSWRALAREFTNRYPDFDHGYAPCIEYWEAEMLEVALASGENIGPKTCSNQLLGMELHKSAAEKLQQDWHSWDDEC
jgi:hypothetical protein